MSIALLEFTLVKAFEKQGVVCRRNSDGILRIEEPHRVIDITLMNLYNEIVQCPEQKTLLIQHFVERVCVQLEMKQDAKKDSTETLYPRILSYTVNKATSHPWTQSFLGEHLEFSIVVHREGRLQFLSPVQVISFRGGLREAKRQAMKNLYTFADQVDVVPVQQTIWRVDHSEVLTSSLVLLLDTFVPSLHTETIQFAVPNRGTLWFSTETLVPFEQHIAQDFRQGSHSISPAVFQTTLDAVRQFRQSWIGQ